MDLDDTPGDASFRAEVRGWLADHARLDDGLGWSRNSSHPDYIANSKRWQATLAAGGWGAITWPREFGGRDATPWQQVIFNEEAVRFDVSARLFSVGIGMTGPTLLAYGTDEQRRRFLPPLLRGEEIWCQLFSEPEAGSDLAALRTSAVVDGDELVVNGQKVWSSDAQHADWGILLVRTDPTVPKHRGLSFLLVDMRTPGIEVRPLFQITGHAHFNEVFLTDVRVPLANVVGSVNGGWGPIVATLTSERTVVGELGQAVTFDRIADLARRCGLDGDPITRQRLAGVHTRLQLLRFLQLRMHTSLALGIAPGPEASIAKLLVSTHLGETADLVMAMLGAGGTLDHCDAPDGGSWQHLFLDQWTLRLGGGTDQIQRNTIGERVLGLPVEPRVDKDLPFNELQRSGRSQP
jgi:alkylation response protein AidB-like acyl-CoA dehydrogenase